MEYKISQKSNFQLMEVWLLHIFVLFVVKFRCWLLYHPLLQILLARRLPGILHTTHCMDVAVFGTRHVLQDGKTLPDPRHSSTVNALSKNPIVRKPKEWNWFMPSLDAPARARRLWLYPHPGQRSSDTPFPAPTRPGCCRCCLGPRHPYGPPQLKAALSLGSVQGTRNKEQTLAPQASSLKKHHFCLYLRVTN